MQRWLHLWQLWEIQLITVDGHTALGCALHLPAGVPQLLPLMHPVVPTPRQPKVTSKQLKQAEQIPCQQSTQMHVKTLPYSGVTDLIELTLNIRRLLLMSCPS